MVRPGAKALLIRTWATLLLCMVFMLLRFFMLVLRYDATQLAKWQSARLALWRTSIPA